MRKLLALRRYLLLSAASLPLMQAGGCVVDPTFVQTLVETQILNITNLLVTGLSQLLLSGLGGALG